jgi:toxin ParE1/3/4
MKIIWSEFASNALKGIYLYHKLMVSEKVARTIRSNILCYVKHLLKHPRSGQTESTLEVLKEGHRYLVYGNYKIIYREVDEGILITDVFDTRQDPQKIISGKK